MKEPEITVRNLFITRLRHSTGMAKALRVAGAVHYSLFEADGFFVYDVSRAYEELADIVETASEQRLLKLFEQIQEMNITKGPTSASFILDWSFGGSDE